MISADTIALVRDRADIVQVIGEAVPSLKLRGRSYVGLCPFHNEKSPSFHVNRDRGFFHCFGCKESGSAIDFLIKLHGMSFPEAVRDLAERFGVVVDEAASQDQDEAQRRKRQRDELYAAMATAAAFYEEQLAQHPDAGGAWDELARRGFAKADLDATARDALQAFRVGYAPAGWDSLAVHLRAHGVSPLVAETVGLLVPRSSGTGHYDRFRQRLMFAVMDVQGRVVAFSGRALAPPANAPLAPGQDPPAKYINSSETPIYSKGRELFGLFQGRSDLRREAHGVVVEGNFDVVSLHARGMRNVVAPLGTAFTPDQAKLLRRFVPAVTLFFDADVAGRKAVEASRTPLREAGLRARVAEPPNGKDPDELARVSGIVAVEAAVAGAKGILEHLMDVALDEGFSRADAFERAERVRRVADLIAEEDDPLVRSMAKSYADRLAGRLDIVREQGSEAFRALENLVKKTLAEVARVVPRGATPRDARVARRPPGAAQRREMLGCVLDFPEILADAEVERGLCLLEGPAALAIVALRRAISAHAAQARPGAAPSFSTQALLEAAPPETVPYLQERLAAPKLESAASASDYFLQNANQLRGLVLAQELKVTASEQDRGDWLGDMARLEEHARKEQLKHGVRVSSAAAAPPAVAAPPAAQPVQNARVAPPQDTALHEEHAQPAFADDDANWSGSEVPDAPPSEPRWMDD